MTIAARMSMEAIKRTPFDVGLGPASAKLRGPLFRYPDVQARMSRFRATAGTVEAERGCCEAHRGGSRLGK